MIFAAECVAAQNFGRGGRVEIMVLQADIAQSS